MDGVNQNQENARSLRPSLDRRLPRTPAGGQRAFRKQPGRLFAGFSGIFCSFLTDEKVPARWKKPPDQTLFLYLMHQRQKGSDQPFPGQAPLLACGAFSPTPPPRKPRSRPARPSSSRRPSCPRQACRAFSTRQDMENLLSRTRHADSAWGFATRPCSSCSTRQDCA